MSYKVVTGDTLEKVASVVYGDPKRATYLKVVNPGLIEPLQVGTVLRTPPIKVTPTPIPSGVAQDDVTISINEKLFDRWTKVTLNQYADRVADFAVECEFNPKDPNMRQAFRPLSFAPVSIAVGKKLHFTGTLIDVSPDSSPTSNTVTASGYSLPGVLMDCVAPLGQELEFYEQTIDQIAPTLVEPYNIETVFFGAPTAKFEPYVAITTSQNIWSFLTRLCSQRSVIMTSDERGRLVFEGEEDYGVVYQVEEGKPPFVSASSSFQPQQIFSSITAAGPVVIGTSAQSFTVNNPLLEDVFRPDVFEMRDAFGDELEIAAKSRAGRMYANAVTIEVTLEGWRNGIGELWRPNTLLSLKAPSINVYSAYEFLIRAVSLTKDSQDGLRTTLTLTFPGSFSGKLPRSLPWT